VPTYQYACTDCGDRSEVVQRLTDAPLSVCSVCGGKLRKVFAPVGIVFKGSGFYRTDSRNGGREKSKDRAQNGSGRDSSAAESGSAAADSGSGGKSGDGAGTKDSKTAEAGSSADSAKSGKSGKSSSASKVA
jgi:putative FmdB family regulatory protein